MRRGGKGVAGVFLLSGVLTIAVGITLILALDELWPLVIVAVGVSDLAIATLMRAGLLSGSTTTERKAGDGGSPLTELPEAPDVDAERNDSFGVSSVENPYARED